MRHLWIITWTKPGKLTEYTTDDDRFENIVANDVGDALSASEGPPSVTGNDRNEYHITKMVRRNRITTETVNDTTKLQ